MRDPRRETRLPRPRTRPPAPPGPAAPPPLKAEPSWRPSSSRRAPAPAPGRRRRAEDCGDQLAAVLAIGAVAVLSHRLTVRACSLAVPPWPALGSVCAAIPQPAAAGGPGGIAPAVASSWAPCLTCGL